MTRYTHESVEKVNKYLHDSDWYVGLGFGPEGELDTFEQACVNLKEIKALYEASLLLEEEE